MHQQLRRLTGEVPLFLSYQTPDRYTGANKELVRLYIVNYLKSLHYRVRFERFEKGMNLVAEIPGTESPDEVFEVTAHYDTVDPGVPGADDNGSGVTALLEFANIFRKHKPRKTLRLVFMDLEEDDFQGSKHHAEKLKEEFFPKEVLGKADLRPKKFLGSLVIDTIAYNPKGQDHLVVLEIGEPRDFGRAWSGTTPGGEAAHAITLACAKDMCFQFARFADATHKRNFLVGTDKIEGLKLQIDIATAKPSTADHGSYWKSELPAFLLAAPFKKPYINPGYHKSSDTIANINWEYYGRVMQFATESVALFTSAEPSLEDNAATRQLLADILPTENVAVTRTEDIVTKLAAQPEPKKKGRSVREVKANGMLVFESNNERGDIVTTEGDDIYISSPSEMETVSRQAAKDNRPIARKKGSGVVTRGDADNLALWLIDYLEKSADKRPPLPDGYELLSKPPVEEKRSWWESWSD